MRNPNLFGYFMSICEECVFLWCAGPCTHLCTCTEKPEDNLGCCFSTAAHLEFFEAESLSGSWDLLISLVCLDTEPQRSAYFYPPLPLELQADETRLDLLHECCAVSSATKSKILVTDLKNQVGSWAWWHKPIISAVFWRPIQEAGKFKASLGTKSKSALQNTIK